MGGLTMDHSHGQAMAQGRTHANAERKVDWGGVDRMGSDTSAEEQGPAPRWLEPGITPIHLHRIACATPRGTP